MSAEQHSIKAGWMLIWAYYWATPLFLLLDLWLGIEIRVSAFIDNPVYRMAYYTFCFFCLGFVHWKPSFSPYIGFLESLGNILILIFGMWMPLVAMTHQAANDQLIVNPITKQMIINFIISGGMGLNSFYQCLLDMGLRKPRFKSIPL